MQIFYDQQTKNYVAFDSNGNWYPTSHTMLGAIQNAISIIFYWNNLTTK